MAGGGDHLAGLDGFAADGADLVAGVAVLGAGGVLGADQLGGVAGGGDFLTLLDDFTADLADFVASVALFGAGGILGTHQLGGVADQLQRIQQRLDVDHQLLLGLGQGIVARQQLPQVGFVLRRQVFDGLLRLNQPDQLQNRLFILIVGIGVDVERGDGGGAGFAGQVVSGYPVGVGQAEVQRSGVGVGAVGQALGQLFKAVVQPGVLSVILNMDSQAALHGVDNLLGLGLLDGGPGQQGVALASFHDGQIRRREVAGIHDVHAALFRVEVLVPHIGGVAGGTLGVVQVQTVVVEDVAVGAVGDPQANEVAVQGQVGVGTGAGSRGLQQRSGHAVEVVILQVDAVEEGLGADPLQRGGEGDGGQVLVAVEGVGADPDGSLGNHEVVGGAALGVAAQGGAVGVIQNAVHALVGQRALGNVDVGQAGAAAEGAAGVAHAAVRQGGGQGDFRQGRAVQEGPGGDGGQRRGQLHAGQLVVVAQHVDAHGGDAVGNHDFGQAGLGEGIGADGLQTVGQLDGHQIRAVIEGVIADFQTVCRILKDHFLDLGGIKGVGADLGDTGGDVDLPDAGVALEHLVRNFRHAVGDGELGGVVVLGPDVDLAGGLEHQHAVGSHIDRVLVSHGEALQAAGVGEGVLVDAGDAGRNVNVGHMGGFPVVQVGKGAVADGNQRFGEDQLLGQIRLIEGLGADGRQLGAGQIQIGQRVAEVEGAVADGLELGGPADAGQLGAVVECVGADGGDVVGHGDLRDGTAVGEGPVRNLRQAAAVDFLGRVAAVKGGVGHGGQGGGQDDAVDKLTAVERVLTDGGQALPEGDLGQLGAVVEGVVADGHQRGGEVRRLQGRALVEGIDADGGQTAAEGGGGQGGAAVEGIVADGSHAVRNGNGGELGAAREGVIADFLQGGGQGDGGQRGLLIEGIRGDGFHAFRHGEGGFGEAVRQPDQRLAVGGVDNAGLIGLQVGAFLNLEALEVLAPVEGVRTEGQRSSAVSGGEDEIFQRGAVIEGHFADVGHLIRHDERGHVLAALEHLLADRGELGGVEGLQLGRGVEGGVHLLGVAQQIDGFQRVAVAEGVVTQVSHGFLNGDRGDLIRVLEAGPLDPGDVLQIGDFLQGRAAEEAVLGQGGQVGGEHDLLDGGALLKLIACGVQFGDAVGHRNGGQRGAEVKGTGADGGDGVGDDKVALQQLTVIEGLGFDGGQALGNHALVVQTQGGQGGAAVEGLGADGAHGFGHPDGLQVVAVVEGPGADFLHAVGEDHIENVVVILEGFLADDPHAVGDGDGGLGAGIGHQRVVHDGEVAAARGSRDGDCDIAGSVAVVGLGGDSSGAGADGGQHCVLGQVVTGAVGLDGDHVFVGGAPFQLQIGGVEGRVGVQPHVVIGGAGQHGHGGGIQQEFAHGNGRRHFLGDGDDTFGLHVGPGGGLGGDGGGAGGLGGDQTVLHHGDGLIGGGPGDVLVRGILGRNGGGELDGAVDGQRLGRLVEGNAGDGILGQLHAIGALVHGVVISHNVEAALGERLIEVGHVKGVGVVFVSPGGGAVFLHGGDDAVVVVGAEAYFLMTVVDVDLPDGGVQGGTGQAEVIGQRQIQIHPSVAAFPERNLVPVHDEGHFAVGGEVEGVGVLQVLLRAVVIHIQRGVVGHVGVVGNQHAGAAGEGGPDITDHTGPDGLSGAVVHGLADIQLMHLGIGFTGVGVTDGDVRRFGAAEHTGLEIIEVADAVTAAQIQRNLIRSGGGSCIAFRHDKGVLAKLEDVHHGIDAGGMGGVHFGSLAVIDVGVLQNGGFGPVAVEGQEGNGKGGIIVVGQLHKAFYIDAVGELGQIRLVLIGELDGDGDFRFAAGRHGDGGSVQTAAGNPDAAGVGGEDVALLGNVLAVGRDGFGLHLGIQRIAVGSAGQVLQGEAQRVDAGAAGIVAQFNFGFLLTADVQVSGGADGGGQIHHTGALLPGGVSHAGFVVEDVGGAHQQPVDQQLLVRIRIGGEQGVDVLQCGGGNTGQIGRGHGGAAHVAVLGKGQGGIDVAAGGGNFGLQLQ